MTRIHQGRRFKRIIIPTGIAIAVFTAFLFLGPRGPDQIDLADLRPIAVIGFENLTGEETYDYFERVIPDLLITNLERLPNVRIPSWERLLDFAEQWDDGQPETVDMNLGYRFCLADSIKTLVTGNITKTGFVIAVNVTVMDVINKNSLSSFRIIGDDYGFILSQLDDLSELIVQATGPMPMNREIAQGPLADLVTNHVEAYQYFMKGKTSYSFNRMGEALKSFDKAVNLDTSFASAYRYLAIINDRHGDLEARNIALQMANRHKAKVPQKDRLLIEALFALYIANSTSEAYSKLEELLNVYPGEKEAHYYLGLAYQPSEMALAESSFLRAIQLDSGFVHAYDGLGQTYLLHGDYGKASAAFGDYSAMFPQDARPLAAMGEIHFRQGKLNESLNYFMQALALDPHRPSKITIAYLFSLMEDYAEAMKWANEAVAASSSDETRVRALIFRAWLAYWLGKYKQCIADFGNARSLAQSTPDNDVLKSINLLEGWIYLDMGDLAASRRSFYKWNDYLIRQSSKLTYHMAGHNWQMAFVDLKSGRIDSSKVRRDLIKSMIRDIDGRNEKDWISLGHDLLNAEIMLKEGFGEDIVSIAESAQLAIGSSTKLTLPFLDPANVSERLPYLFLADILARAYHQKGLLNHAIREYERLTTMNGSPGLNGPIYPPFYLRLAALHAENGETAKAINRYRAFLSIWKEADSDLPILADANMRLAELGGTD